MCVKLAQHNCIMQSLPGRIFVDLSSQIPIAIQEGTILQSGKEVSQLTRYTNFLFITECKIEFFNIFLTQLSLKNWFSQKYSTSINFSRVVIDSLDVLIFSRHTRTRRQEIYAQRMPPYIWINSDDPQRSATINCRC